MKSIDKTDSNISSDLLLPSSDDFGPADSASYFVSAINVNYKYFYCYLPYTKIRTKNGWHKTFTNSTAGSAMKEEYSFKVDSRCSLHTALYFLTFEI